MTPILYNTHQLARGLWILLTQAAARWRNFNGISDFSFLKKNANKIFGLNRIF